MKSTLPTTGIRPATIDDIPFILRMNEEGIDGWSKDFKKQISPWRNVVCTHEHIQEMVTNPKKIVYVFENEGRKIGTGYSYVVGGTLYVGGIYFESDQQGQGRGSALLDFIESNIIETPVRTLKCAIYSQNYPALRFFAKRGWKQISADTHNGITYFNYQKEK